MCLCVCVCLCMSTKMESFQCSDISTVVLLLFFFQNFNSAALTYVCLELFYRLQCRFLLSKIVVFVVSRQHTLILWTFNFVLQSVEHLNYTLH